jgi:hypothetical protein
LAFVFLLAMYSTVYSSRIHVGRFLTDALADDLLQYAGIIEKECFGISWRFLRCVRVIMVVMTFFYALFVFDAIGDAHGAKDSFLIIIAVFAVPLALWGGIATYDWYQGRRHPETGSVSSFADAQRTVSKMFNGVELSNIPEDPGQTAQDVNSVKAPAVGDTSAGLETSEDAVFNTVLHASPDRC